VASKGSAVRSIKAPVQIAEHDYHRKFLHLLDAQETAPALEKLTAEIRQGVAAGELPPAMVDDVEIVLRLHDNFDNKRKREKELSALYETARDLSALRNTDQVLQAIVQRARQLVGSDIAYISAADDERNDFYVRATEGVVSQDFARIRVPRNIGVCGSVARTRRPFYSSNYATDSAFAHDSSIDHATQGEGVISILGIPLEVEAYVIGVLFVGDRYTRSYTPNEMAVLSSLGTFAALAIENARLLEEARRALQTAKDANAALKAKAEDIENAAAAHEQLTELIARGGTLDDLTERVSKILGGEAAVLDERQKPISGTIPDNMSSEALIRAVRESDRLGRSVQVHCDEGGVALVAAAIGGSARLGSLVFKRKREFSAAEVRTFERSAIVTGIVLLSLERVAQSAHKSASDAISALVRGTSDPFAGGTPRHLPGGTALNWPLTMMIVDLGDRPYIQVAAAARTALSGRDTIFAEFSGDLVAVTSSETPRELAGRLSERLVEATQVRFSVAVSDSIASIEDSPSQYEALRRCHGLLRSLGQSGRIVFERSLSMYAMLFGDKRSDAVTSFIHSTIGPILDADSRKGSHLAQTLLAYLDEGRSLQKAANKVGIHVNTMRQRLDLIGQINPASLNPEQGLETHLALRMHLLRQFDQRH
jgi:GAF domain-containing protein